MKNLKSNTYFFETVKKNFFIFQKNKKGGVLGAGFYVDKNLKPFPSGHRKNAQMEVAWAINNFNPHIKKASAKMHKLYMKEKKLLAPKRAVKPAQQNFFRESDSLKELKKKFKNKEVA